MLDHGIDVNFQDQDGNTVCYFNNKINLSFPIKVIILLLLKKWGIACKGSSLLLAVGHG